MRVQEVVVDKGGLKITGFGRRWRALDQCARFSRRHRAVWNLLAVQLSIPLIQTIRRGRVSERRAGPGGG